MTDYRLMIGRLRPTSEYKWNGDDDTDYNALGEWRDPNTTAPTRAELDSEWTIYQDEQAMNEQIKAAVTPAQVAALLDRIDARQAQIDQRRATITADLALLPTATAAQQRQIIGRLLNSEDDTLTAEKQELTALDRLIRAMRQLV